MNLKSDKSKLHFKNLIKLKFIEIDKFFYSKIQTLKFLEN